MEPRQLVLTESDIQSLRELLEYAEEGIGQYPDHMVPESIKSLLYKLRDWAAPTSNAAALPYDVKSVDATQVACANRLFHDNPTHIPQNYGEYTNPLVGDQFGADAPPVKKAATESRPQEGFGQPFHDD